MPSINKKNLPSLHHQPTSVEIKYNLFSSLELPSYLNWSEIDFWGPSQISQMNYLLWHSIIEMEILTGSSMLKATNRVTVLVSLSRLFPNPQKNLTPSQQGTALIQPSTEKCWKNSNSSNVIMSCYHFWSIFCLIILISCCATGDFQLYIMVVWWYYLSDSCGGIRLLKEMCLLLIYPIDYRNRLNISERFE
jgi:hypothetical protein